MNAFLTGPFLLGAFQVDVAMQHYGVNGYSLHAMNSLSAMYNLHQQAAQQAQHAPDYRPSVHALTLAERLAGKNNLWILPLTLGMACAHAESRSSPVQNLRPV